MNKEQLEQLPLEDLIEKCRAFPITNGAVIIYSSGKLKKHNTWVGGDIKSVTGNSVRDSLINLYLKLHESTNH